MARVKFHDARPTQQPYDPLKHLGFRRMTAGSVRSPGPSGDGAQASEASSPEPVFCALMALGLAEPAQEAWGAGPRRKLRWKETRARFVDRQVAGYRGQIFRGANNGLLAGFRRAIDAVRCAVELQRDIPVANSAAPDQEPIEICIGIDVCHLNTTEDEISAESNEIAAGLLERAGPGGIAVSGEIEVQLRGTADIETEMLGLLPNRKSSRPIYAHRVAYRRIGDLAPLPRQSALRQVSLAILPFGSGSSDRRDDYFAEGIAEDIVSALAGVSDLLVVSTGSNVPHAGDRVDLRAIGRQLSVRYVVSGTARRDGDVVTIAVDFADTDSGKVLWNEKYRVALSNLFDLQEDIALRIARAVAPRVGEAELRRSAGKRPESMDAYDLVLQAMYRMYRLDRDEFATVPGLLKGAIDLDPAWGTPYTLLAEWHTLDIGQGYCEDETAAMADLVRLATSALERNPSDARALALLGHSRAWLFRNYDEALDLFERAFAAAPNSSLPWGWSSPTCSYLGDGASAVVYAEYALRLSPLSPHAYFFRAALGLAHYTNGDYDEAARWGRRTMAANPRHTSNLRILAASLAAWGRVQDARSVGHTLLTLRPDFSIGQFVSRYSYKDPKRMALLADHLRLAGLPD
jgi:TolB-like protein